MAVHALCDTLLGALAPGDIGKLFPDSSDEFKGIDSKILRIFFKFLKKKLEKSLQFHKTLLPLQSQFQSLTRGRDRAVTFGESLRRRKGRHFPHKGGREGEFKLRYGVMVALQILALSVRVRVLLSQQGRRKSPTGIRPANIRWRDSSAG